MAIEQDMKKFRLKVERSLNELTSQSNLSPIATDLTEIIRRRTRLGYGVEKTGQPKQKLQPLASSTVRSRARKKSHGALSEKTSPKKSNLTETGQMLDSLRGRAINKLIEIGPTGDRNKKLTAYHQLGNAKLPKRRFLNLAREDIRQLTAVMQDRFSIILEKVFGKN